MFLKVGAPSSLQICLRMPAGLLGKYATLGETGSSDVVIQNI